MVPLIGNLTLMVNIADNGGTNSHNSIGENMAKNADKNKQTTGTFKAKGVGSKIKNVHVSAGAKGKFGADDGGEIEEVTVGAQELGSDHEDVVSEGTKNRANATSNTLISGGLGLAGIVLAAYLAWQWST